MASQIHFEAFTLDNGLRVVVHEDRSVGVAALNLLYDVGSRDEDSRLTGFAHLFEHLMFGGSVHVPDYDRALQRVGGSNNAFTTSDFTSYHVAVAGGDIETAFWLESDRMLSLSFRPETLEVQRNVVIEEYKQRYLNRPYGDAWMRLCELAYRVHPYRWTPIGKEIAHLEQISLQDVKEFFYTYYRPNNAILAVAGYVEVEQIKALAQKWFAPIPPGNRPPRALPVEPPQQAKRTLAISAPVPAAALYKAYPMPGRFHADYRAADLLSALLGYGDSSRLYRRLVEERGLLNAVSTFTTGSLDPGLLAITGMPREGVSLEEAEQAVDDTIAEFIGEELSELELEKAKNQSLAELVFGRVEILNRAIELAFSTLSAHTGWINEEADRIQSVRPSTVHRLATELLTESRASTLLYRAQPASS